MYIGKKTTHSPQMTFSDHGMQKAKLPQRVLREKNNGLKLKYIDTNPEVSFKKLWTEYANYHVREKQWE